VIGCTPQLVRVETHRPQRFGTIWLARDLSIGHDARSVVRDDRSSVTAYVTRETAMARSIDNACANALTNGELLRH
jgi:hypothetical protein